VSLGGSGGHAVAGTVAGGIGGWRGWCAGAGSIGGGRGQCARRRKRMLGGGGKVCGLVRATQI
jgi:hypothetical protein